MKSHELTHETGVKEPESSPSLNCCKTFVAAQYVFDSAPSNTSVAPQYVFDSAPYHAPEAEIIRNRENRGKQRDPIFAISTVSYQTEIYGTKTNIRLSF